MTTLQVSKQNSRTVAGMAGGRTRFRSVLPVLLAFLLIVGGLAPAGLAQSASTGAVSGTVTDPASAVVVSAKVTATNTATGEKQTMRLR